MANQRKVGLKIEIDGEAEYKKAIQNINKDNQLLNAELRALAEEYKNNSDSMEYLTNKGEKLQSQLIENEAKVVLLKDALRKAKEEYGGVDERTTEWAIKLANAETALNKTKNAIEDNNKAMLQQQHSVEDLDKANEALSAELRRVQEQYKGNEKSVDGLKEKNEILQKQLENQQIKVQRLRDALRESTAQYGEADERTTEWAIKLANAETALNKTKNAIEDNNKAMLQQQHSVEDLDKANEALSAELRRVQEQYKGNEKSVDGLKEKNEILQKQLENQQIKVQRLRDALRESTAQYGEADERTTEWAIKLANAETEQLKLEHAIQENNDALQEQEGAMEDAGKAVGRLGDQVDELGGALGIRLPDMAKDALNSMAGFSAGTVAKLAAVAGGAAAVIKVTQELYDLTKQAAAEADALLTRSAQTGLSTDLLQQLDYAQQFLDFDGLDKSLQRLTQSMGNATNASTKQAEAFRTLGVSIYDENGKLRDNYDVFLDVIDALGNVESETQRDIIANQLFGKSYAELLPLIQAGSDELKKHTDRAREMGYVLGEEGVRALGRFDDALNENRTAIKAAKDDLAAALAPMFETFVELNTGAVNLTHDLFSNDTFRTIAGAVSAPLGALMNVAEGLKIFQNWRDELNATADDTEDAGERMTAAITPMQDAVQALADKYQEAREKYRDMLDGQFGLFEDASDRMLTDSDRAAQALGEFWNSAYESAEKSIQGQFGLFDHAKTSFQQFCDDYATAWSTTFQQVQSAVDGVWGTYEEAVGFSMKSGQEMNAAYDSQKHYWEWYESTLDQVLNSGIEGVREWAAATADGSKDSAAALGGFLNASEEAQQIIVDSFRQMKDAETEAADAITDLKTRGSLSMEEYATFMQEKADEMISAQQSQLDYWTEYEENLEALWNSGIEGIQAYVQANSDGSAKSVEAIAVMAAATDEQKEKILSTYQALEDKQADVAQNYANLATAGAQSSEELAGSTESWTQRQLSSLDSQLEYFQEYKADFEALKARNIEGIDELAKKFMDGSAESKAALAELRGASDEEIAAIIAKMHEVDTERGGLADTFAALDVDLSEQFAKIKSDWAGTVQEITGTEIDFGPFNEAVKASFGDLTETAKNTANTVKTELGSIPAEIAALQPLQEKQTEVGAGFAALKEAGAGSMAELAAATAESTDSITAAFDGQSAALSGYAEEFDAITTGAGDSAAAMAERFTAAGTDAGAALQELAETATNVSAEVSDALAVMEENFAVTCADSEESLDALAVAADEKISAMIVTLAQTEAAKDDFVARFDELTEKTVADLDQIQTETSDFVEEFNVIIASVDFAPFTDSVDSAFSFLEDRAWSSIDNVRGWLAELSAEIDAIEARAANVNVGHNAGGTDNWRGGLTYLAEAGPELVDLPQGSRVHTAQETRQILGGGTDMRETEAKLDRAVSLLGQISAELSGLRVRGRMA